MVKIQIELPEKTVEAACEAGLLTPESLDRLITDAIRRRQAADRLLSIAERVAAAGGESLTAAEIEAEVRAERQDRRSRAGGS